MGNMGFKGLFIEHGVPEEHIQEFGEWAFGPNFRSLMISSPRATSLFSGISSNGLDFMNAWNEIHADKLRLSNNSRICEDARQMVILFNEREKVKQMNDLERKIENLNEQIEIMRAIITNLHESMSDLGRIFEGHTLQVYERINLLENKK
jgi:hypothetical protein